MYEEPLVAKEQFLKPVLILSARLAWLKSLTSGTMLIPSMTCLRSTHAGPKGSGRPLKAAETREDWAAAQHEGAKWGTVAKRALRTEVQWSLRVDMSRTQSIQGRNHTFCQQNAGVCLQKSRYRKQFAVAAQSCVVFIYLIRGAHGVFAVYPFHIKHKASDAFFPSARSCRCCC